MMYEMRDVRCIMHSWCNEVNYGFKKNWPMKKKMKKLHMYCGGRVLDTSVSA